jgi:hypothetical protein
MDPQDSVVLITSRDPQNRRFGTGFVIRRSRSAVHVLTCAHVVADVGGADQVEADGIAARVTTLHDSQGYSSQGLDLAVLELEGLWQRSPLMLKNLGKQGITVKTIGFQQYDKERKLRPLQGHLGKRTASQIETERIQTWDLHIGDDYGLKPGYSGSPVIDPETNCVVGVVSHREEQGERGSAISIAALQQIWPMVDSTQLYRILIKLGYRQQVRLFRKLVNQSAVAAFLIYGSPEHGQRWLLNRLVSQYVQGSLTDKVVPVSLSRRARRNDVQALWRELARQVGLKPTAPIGQILDRVYKWWTTQNVLLVFHDVDYLPEPCFQDLLQQFWLPLADRVRQQDQQQGHKQDLQQGQQQGQGHKLLMFLIDYEGHVGQWDAPFVEKLDATWTPQLPIRSPRLEEFSDQELIDWIVAECDELPREFHNEDAIVQEILDNSEDGIPEQVLQEICDRCGCDWYEELEKWLKL